MVNRGTKLDNGDIAGIVVYFILVVGVGIFIGASLFASNIGTEHFIGLAGSGAAVGISVGAFEINGLLILQLMGWVFLPVYIASKAYTLPEYIKKRFGGSRIRIYLASLSLTLYIFTKISVALYSGSLFIRQSLEWNQWLAILLLLGITALTSITGGLKAAIYTEVLQAVSILIGAGAILVLAFIRVGGYKNLVQQYPDAKPNGSYAMPNTSCSVPLDDAFVMLREPTDPNLPWPGFLLGQTTVSIWYWAADQMMVQRALAAKSLSHAQGGCLLAGYFKFMFLFVMILPGMIARVLWPNEIACSDPDVCFALCENRRGCTDMTYPKLVMELLPSGVRGLMMAVMLSALVSDLISIFNSASALFTIDIWSKIRKKVESREVLVVGRLFNILLLVISVVWVPFIQEMQGGQLFFYIKAIAAYLSPPIGAVYILAISWSRCNEQGAFYGLMSGLVVGVSRMILDFVYRSPECGSPDTRPLFIRSFHYMYFAVLLFSLTMIVAFGVSWMTEPPSKKRLIRTTFATRFDTASRSDDFKYDRRKSSYIMDVMTLDTLGDSSADVSERTEPRPPSSNEAYEIEPGSVIGAGGLLKKKDGGQESVMVGPNGRGTSTPLEGKGKLLHDSPIPGCAVETVLRHLKSAADWFCGFSMLTAAQKGQNEAHLDLVSSLEQDRTAKLVLNVNLGVLVVLAIFAFIFFSTPLHDLTVQSL